MRLPTPVLWVLLSPLVVGCAGLPHEKGTFLGGPEARAAEINRLRTQARVLRYSGRYVEALERLDAALALRVGDADLLEERTETEKAWQHLEAELQDRLLVIKVRSAERRLPLLRRLVRASPDDRALRDELDGLLRDQGQRAAALSACGRRQADVEPALARRCLRLALAARDNDADRALLAHLQPKPAARVRPETPRTAETPPETPVKAAAKPAQEPWLVKARALMADGQHYGAIRLLEKTLSKNPGSTVARRLLEEARGNLERNMDAMLSSGDKLYREGRVKEALTVWQAAVEMNPESVQAREKSERALRVLQNIESLRESQ